MAQPNCFFGCWNSANEEFLNWAPHVLPPVPTANQGGWYAGMPSCTKFFNRKTYENATSKPASMPLYLNALGCLVYGKASFAYTDHTGGIGCS